MAFFRENIFSTEKLSKILEAESIHMILRKSSEGQVYGITYVDYKTRSVFNGSSLGKEFSAKGIQESCAMNILAFERKHQNSVSTNSANFQDFESRAYIKENLTEILLRGEKVNDYVSKQFKQKKRKIRRVI